LIPLTPRTRRAFRWWLATTALLLLALCPARSQSPPSQPFGTRFLVPFPDTLCAYTGSIAATGAEAAVVLFAEGTARVSLSAPGFARTVTVAAGGDQVVDLADALPGLFLDAPNVATARLLRIESDAPISVVCYFATGCGSEAFAPLPVEAWGHEYLVATLPGRRILNTVNSTSREEGFTPVDAPAEIVIVASENGTVVTVDPGGATLGPTARTFTLDAGEVRLIESAVGTGTSPDDLTGTRISATKPIGVLCGNTRSNAGESRFPELLPTGNSTRNVLVEWAGPISSAGGTFVYVPALGADTATTDESIRIVASSAGTTAVTTSGVVPWKNIPEGSFAEFSSTEWNRPGSPEPLAFHTDRPALAFLTTGADAVRLSSDGSGNAPINAVASRASALTTMLPYEQWIAAGRFYAPPVYPSMRHYLLIAADENARVSLDGRDITSELTPVKRAPFRAARIEIAAGTHGVAASGGRFTATAYGVIGGYEEIRPLATNKKGPTTEGALMPHPTEYQESIGAAYAYPVPGATAAAPGDTLSFTRVEKCDSASVTVVRSGSAWTSGTIAVEPDPSSRNMDLLAIPTYSLGTQTGYRLRFAPSDPTRDAEGSAILTNLMSGRVWSVPYTYSAEAVSARPSRLSFTDTVVGHVDNAVLTLVNRRPFTVTVLSAETTGRDGSIGPADPMALPRTLAAGDSFDLVVRYDGTSASDRDTLVVRTDCTPLSIVVETATALRRTEPTPKITGYDWRVRRVGSSNDTVSVVFNDGNTLYRFIGLRIVSDPASAFTFVAPWWTRLDTVRVDDRFDVGIRFSPPFEGEFTSEIELTASDGRTARAVLHGIGVSSGIATERIAIGTRCAGTSLDTTLMIRNIGTVDATVTGVEIRPTAAARITLDTAGLGLPRRIPPGGALGLRVRIDAIVPGTATADMEIRTETVTVITQSAVTATVEQCADGRIAVDDHDFGTVWMTLSRSGHVTLRNSGGTDIAITDIKVVDDPSDAFATLPVGLPFVLPAGGTKEIACRFSPGATGPFTARIRFETAEGTLYSLLRGVGDRLVVPAHIARDYRARLSRNAGRGRDSRSGRGCGRRGGYSRLGSHPNRIRRPTPRPAIRRRRPRNARPVRSVRRDHRGNAGGEPGTAARRLHRTDAVPDRVLRGGFDRTPLYAGVGPPLRRVRRAPRSVRPRSDMRTPATTLRVGRLRVPPRPERPEPDILGNGDSVRDGVRRADTTCRPRYTGTAPGRAARRASEGRTARRDDTGRNAAAGRLPLRDDQRRLPRLPSHGRLLSTRPDPTFRSVDVGRPRILAIGSFTLSRWNRTYEPDTRNRDSRLSDRL